MKNLDLVPEHLQTPHRPIVPADQTVCLWRTKEGQFCLAADPEQFTADPLEVAGYVLALLNEFLERNTGDGE